MSGLTLYTGLRTRGSRPHWVLEELGLDYAVVWLDDPAAIEPNHPRHPLSRVPLLDDGGLVLFESAALCVHLADKDPGHRLLAAAGTAARALTEQWLFFLMTELEVPLDLVALHTVELPEAERVAAIVPWAMHRFAAAARVVDTHLGGSAFMVGGCFSIADIVLSCMMSWASRREVLAPFANLRAHCDRMLDRPAARRLFATSPPS